MCRKLIAVCLAGCVLLSPVLALPSPPPSSSGVWLSDEEAAEMEAAILQAQEALDRSSDKIAAQEKDLKRLYWLCGALAIVLAVDATAHLVIAIKN
jgi:hypothetical protein